MSATDIFAPGSAALITGGASGIGLAVVRLCRSKEMKVLLVDRNADALKKAKDEISGNGPAGHDVVTPVADVGQPDSWKAVKEAATQTLETNVFGVVNGVNAFLPVIQDAAKSKPTAIVITGSKQGITKPPGNAAYNASKAATGGGQGKKPAGVWTPEQVADYLYRKMGENKFYVMCPDNEDTVVGGRHCAGAAAAVEVA